MIRRRCRLKVRRNAEGKPRERFEGLRDEDFRAWIRERRCLLVGAPSARCAGRVEAAHVESKARGAGDAGNLAPLCLRHHREQHDYGIQSFQREYGVNLRLCAGDYWLRFEREVLGLSR